MPTEFDPKEFWEKRLAEDFTLDGTGTRGFGVGFNRWTYRVQRHVFNRTVRRFLDASESRVLDVGSGTGFFVDRWRELGARDITGSDITSKSATELAARYPDHRFVQLDIGARTLPLDDERFDVVSAIAVLFHIVDDASYARAFRNLFDLLEPGGLLIFSDNFLRQEPFRRRHQAFRSEGEVESAVRGAGFEFVTRRPLFVLTNTPVSSDSAVLNAWWPRLKNLLLRRPGLGTALGALLYPPELACVTLARRAPSLELAVCRKPS